MKFFATILASMIAVSAVVAVPVDIVSTPQCGGLNWQGPTTCSKEHTVCFKFNDYYSECIHESKVAMWSVGKPQ